jgi:hypothetical protein
MDANLKASGRVLEVIQLFVMFIILTAEFTSRVLNAICLFLQLTQLGQVKRRKMLFPSKIQYKKILIGSYRRPDKYKKTSNLRKQITKKYK